MRCNRSSFCAVLVALTAACSTAPTDGGGGAGTATNPTGTTDPGKTGSCGGSGLGLDCLPKMQVDDQNTGQTLGNNSVVQIIAGDLKPGDVAVEDLAVSNHGTATLAINSATLKYEAKSPDEANDPAFTCTSDDGKGGSIPCNGSAIPGVAASGTPVHLKIAFKKFKDDIKRVASLTIATNDVKNHTNGTMTIMLVASSGAARIEVSPKDLDLGFVAMGDSKVGKAAVIAVGNSPLSIDEIDVSALNADLFTLAFNDGNTPVTAPLVIQPGGQIEVKVVYTGKDDKPHVGDIIFKTNDSSLNAEGGLGWKRLKVKVNSSGPCLKVEPLHVVFGVTAVSATAERPVQLQSCGDQPVCVEDVAFDAPGQGPFALDWSAAGGKAPTKEAPVCIPVNGAALVKVRYTPTQLSKTDASGQPMPDKAGVTVRSNSGAEINKFTIEGVAGTGDCPTGIITIAEGDTVTPQTVLHLDGKQSYAANSKIATYKWTVQQPAGSVSIFSLNDHLPSVQFQPNVAGDYKFRLVVTDATGKPSCFPAEKIVKVLPDQALHVELLWDTPGDKDQTDEGPDAGADLDLHVAHQFAAMPDYDLDQAPDPWFADQYDCYWATCSSAADKNLEWGSYDPNSDDNPHLDRDDTDGAGPENMNLTQPEEGKTYKVGVHYFKDHGFGPSTATVRVYIYGDIKFEKKSTSMVKGDMWFAALITWPQQEVEAVANPKDNKALFITPKYPAPAL